MKRLSFLAMASSVAIAAASPVDAAIFIGIGFNGGAVTQVSSDGGLGFANYDATAAGLFYNSGATGFPILTQPSLLTQSINIQQAGGAGRTLNLYITQTDLGPFSGSLISSFTSNTMSNATAVIRSFYSTSNALFGGTQLESAAFNSMGIFSGTDAISIVVPFSTTVRYDITFGPGAANFNGTANLTAVAVPEPATWAMMLLGFGGLGYATRRRMNVGMRIRFI